MIYRNFFLLVTLLGNLTIYAQVTTIPSLPVSSNKVTITFDSSKESRLGYFTGELYAHTGVIIEGVTDWKHVIGSWGNNSLQPKLTNKGDGIYELEISPDVNTFYSVGANEKVLKLAFVIRSADGSKQTNDFFITIFNKGLNIEISEPANNTIISLGQTVTISANTSIESSIKISLNETILKQTTGTAISVSKTFNESGNFWLIAEATVSNETKYDSTYICIKGNVINQPKPEAYLKGINYPTDNSAALVLWTPNKEFVFVLGDFNNWQPRNEYQMKKDGDYFWLEIDNLEKGKEYIFQYYIDSKILIADPYTEKISDPWNDKYILDISYPGLIQYPEGKTEEIASVLQPGQEIYQWESTNFQIPEKEKMIIYELLIRDFTEEHTYQSVIEKLDYLKDLRINILELMPINEFEGNESWGYNPSFYFAPDKFYGPKNKLKKLIDECHKRGIAVVIDMVLNHSYGQSPFARMYMENWEITAENPWYNQQHNFQNPDAHWGFDFNHESLATQELADSITSFWVNEYKVDGFRFDFTKGFSNTVYGPSSWGSAYDSQRITNLKRMADKIWNINENTIIIFEHLADNSEEKVLANYGILLWGNMSNNYGEAAMGYNESNKSNLEWGVYNKRSWNNPNLVTYMESHDEERVMYKIKSFGKSTENYNTKNLSTSLDRMELNSVFLIPLPGPKMIWQFGERGYDFSINDFGGRLSIKPPHWEYLENTDRTDLFKVISKLNYLKQNYTEFTPQLFSYDLTSEIKWYKFNTGSNHVVGVGNFSTEQKVASITFPEMGTYYEYFSKSTFIVNASPKNVPLAPGEYKLYSTRQFEDPDIETTLKINQSPAEIISIFPNPATNRINITSEIPFSNIIIQTITGTTVFSKTFYSEKKAEVNLSPCKPGIYFIRILQGGKNTTKKFIIQ